MTRRHHLAASLLISLSGCVSSTTAPSRQIIQTVHSQSQPAQVARCLAERNRVPFKNVTQSDDGSTAVLIKNQYGALSMLFTIYPESTGSRIDIREGDNLIKPKHRQCF